MPTSSYTTKATSSRNSKATDTDYSYLLTNFDLNKYLPQFYVPNIQRNNIADKSSNDLLGGNDLSNEHQYEYDLKLNDSNYSSTSSSDFDLEQRPFSLRTPTTSKVTNT